jgi:beta-glucuronidase
MGFALLATCGDARAADTGLSGHTVYQDGPTGRQLLGGHWTYRSDPEDQGLGAHYELDQGSAGWDPVRIPFNWNAQDNTFDQASIGWLRAKFTAPSSGRWNVRFESVSGKASVWLNGRFIGSHDGAYLPFELRALSLRKGSNQLTVRVDTHHTPSDLTFWNTDPMTGRARYGWWNFGGISREVYLRHIDHLDVSHIAAVPTVRCAPDCTASLRVSATLRSLTSKPWHAWIKVRVGTRLITFHPRKLGAGRSVTLATTVQMPHPRLWSPEHPSLYPVRTRAYVDDRATKGQPVAGVDLNVGLRTLRRDSTGRLFLNDKPLLLHGASHHEDTRFAGSAWGSAQWNTIAQEYLALHANVVRSHYPLHPAFLELCDRLGLLVWDEVPVYQTPNSTLDQPYWRNKALGWDRAMVERDHNHASVFTYAVSNELPADIGAGQAAYLDSAVTQIKAADPSRFVAIDRYSDGQYRSNPVLRRFDLHGITEYFGWYSGTVPGGGSFLDKYHATFPGQTLVIVETGAEANHSGDVTQKGTYEFQAQYMHDQLATFAQRPYIAGAMVWALRDFRVQPGWSGGNPTPSAPWNMKGLSDRFTGPKPAFQTVSDIYAGIKDGAWPAGLAATAPVASPAAKRASGAGGASGATFGPSPGP